MCRNICVSICRLPTRPMDVNVPCWEPFAKGSRLRKICNGSHEEGMKHVDDGKAFLSCPSSAPLTKIRPWFIGCTRRTGRLPTRDINGRQARCHLNDLDRIQRSKGMRITSNLVQPRQERPKLVGLLRRKGHSWGLSLASTAGLE